MLENLYEPTEISTKNSSNFMKNTVKRFDTPKTELNASQKSVPGKRNFLANTNGP